HVRCTGSSEVTLAECWSLGNPRVTIGVRLERCARDAAGGNTAYRPAPRGGIGRCAVWRRDHHPVVSIRKRDVGAPGVGHRRTAVYGPTGAAAECEIAARLNGEVVAN